MASPVDKNYPVEIKKAREELEIEISKDKSARDLLCLAYAYQFSIANDAAKSTAKKHHKTIEKIHTNHPTITYPDLYQLAGVAAIKKLQGPEIEFVPGRVDSQIIPDKSCLPDLKPNPLELRDFFGKVQISETKHIVALYGSLKLATAGDQGENLKFDNSYFVNLDKGKESTSDQALLDKEFRDFVKRYANNKDYFFKDYIEAHTKLSAVGLPSPPIKTASQVQNVIDTTPRTTLKETASRVQNLIDTTPRAVGVGVAVAAAVLIFSVFYLINKRRTQHPSQQFQ